MKLAAWEIVLRVVAVALVIDLGTAWFAWWCVPVIAFVYAAIDRGVKHRGVIASVAAIIGWGTMLLWYSHGEALSGVERAAGVVGVPLAALAIVTLVFGVVLAACGAVIGAAVRR
jgi:hypothetical protein